MKLIEQPENNNGMKLAASGVALRSESNRKTLRHGGVENWGYF